MDAQLRRTNCRMQLSTKLVNFSFVNEDIMKTAKPKGFVVNGLDDACHCPKAQGLFSPFDHSHAFVQCRIRLSMRWALALALIKSIEKLGPSPLLDNFCKI